MRSSSRCKASEAPARKCWWVLSFMDDSSIPLVLHQVRRSIAEYLNNDGVSRNVGSIHGGALPGRFGFLWQRSLGVFRKYT